MAIAKRIFAIEAGDLPDLVKFKKEDTMNSIILAVTIVAICRAVKIIIRRELKKYRSTNDNNLKGAIGA